MDVFRRVVCAALVEVEGRGEGCVRVDRVGQGAGVGRG